ncbi:SepM family pheromone-processing serine protease [Paenibacillus macerans]|uniref:endopeptidase La n=1 Tax=Paenibacillus macerans TaxID=44252 RepID=A0A090ZFN0_PAEMA|nr:SepM family pheromone-processing serine protease [Paenibacillus macerans]KFN09233.1 PDZ domain protein [Paenibacillus macerans]MCY7559931.1 PDZ domain-containing protein [Paenibacillus macerans]MEC0155070.1 SepM family pheromone-processing serine protease [Paenibacillus macerans]SUA82740.1 peptidase S16 lon domain-containing protein [Paenibacillus macerans]
MRQSRSIAIKAGLYVLTMAVIVYVVVFMNTPYMINQPGTAEEVKPIVSIESGDKEEKGAFMLTTVSVSYANLWMLATSPFNKDAEVVRKEPDRNDAEYETEQRYYMSSSQSSAVMAAYRKAGVKYDVVSQYVFIIGLSKESEPKGNFLSGDIIRAVDGQPVKRFEDLAPSLQGKKPGDIVPVQLSRDGKTVEEQVELVQIVDAEGIRKAGLGVSVGEVLKVEAADKAKEVTFADTEIGGPSAGLMFTLEIYNQLTPGDLTKGHRIAGTGTISEDGTVGPIGGVQFKIVAAEREKAEIFFVPEANYKDAKAKAEKIGSKMELVPVKKLDDALNYLQALKPKA